MFSVSSSTYLRVKAHLVVCTALHGNAFSASATMLSTPTAFFIRKDAPVCSKIDIAIISPEPIQFLWILLRFPRYARAPRIAHGSLRVDISPVHIDVAQCFQHCRSCVTFPSFLHKTAIRCKPLSVCSPCSAFAAAKRLCAVPCIASSHLCCCLQSRSCSAEFALFRSVPAISPPTFADRLCGLRQNLRNALCRYFSHHVADH